MPAPDQADAIWTAVKSGVPGGVIGALLVHFHNIWRQKKQKSKDVQSPLKSFKAEIQALWAQHKEALNVDDFSTLNVENGFLSIYPVSDDYFTIYHKSADKIGTIQNEELQILLIKTYSKAKGLLDSFRLNNQFIQRIEDFSNEYAKTDSQIIIARMHLEAGRLKEYGHILIASNIRVQQMVDDLIIAIDKEIAKMSCCIF